MHPYTYPDFCFVRLTAHENTPTLELPSNDAFNSRCVANVYAYTRDKRQTPTSVILMPQISYLGIKDI